MIKGVLNSAAYMLLLLTLTSTTCSKYKQLQKEPPVKIGQVYFQKWISGVQGGGSGIDLFIPVEETKIQFAESSQEEESNLLWMELHCRSCKNYTLYQRK